MRFTHYTIEELLRHCHWHSDADAEHEIIRRLNAGEIDECEPCAVQELRDQITDLERECERLQDLYSKSEDECYSLRRALADTLL